MANEGGDCPIRRDGLCSAVVTATEQLKNMTKWQENQNGSLRRIGEKQDKFKEEMLERLDGLKSWAIGMLTGVAVAVILLALNLALKRF